MFGYACDETPELMPAPIHYAHRLMERQAELRKTALCLFAPRCQGASHHALYGWPPAKRVQTVVISSQHSPEMSVGDTMKPAFIEAVVESIIR